ncbi:MAG: OB-fold-containig protein [Pseudomonadota bacterium]
MLEFFGQAGMGPFAFALILLLALLLLEVIGALLGAPWSALFGDTDVDVDVDVDLDADIDADVDGDVGGGIGPIAGAFSWIGIGRVPLVILLAAFLASFGAAGAIIQQIATPLGGLLPAWLASIIALPPSLFSTRWVSIGFRKLFPNDVSTAVSQDSLVGNAAEVTVGTATSELPAEARTHDQHGHVHYVRVRPESLDDSFPKGTRVLLVAREGTVFNAIKMPERDIASIGHQD